MSEARLTTSESDATQVEQEQSGQDTNDENGPNSKDRRRSWLRTVIAEVSPSWFASTMGTGIVAINLYHIPYPTSWLRTASVVFFIGNAALFSLLTVAIILRLLLERDWRSMTDHRGQGLFLGTIPMGFATLISMWTFVCVDMWGHKALDAAWILWIIDEVVSVAVIIGLLTVFTSHSPTSLNTITPLHILPFIPPIVSAGTGAAIVAAMPLPLHSSRATASLSLCYLSLGIGLSFSLLIMCLYFIRLIMHGPPKPAQRSSLLIPLGPLGQSSATLIVLGKAATSIGSSNDRVSMGLGDNAGNINMFNTLVGQGLHATGTMLALLMWGMGLVWLSLACISFIFGKGKMQFSAGWWGLIFPMGVYAFAALQFGTILGDGTIGQGHGGWGVVGTFFTVWLIINWIIVVGGVIHSVASRVLSTKSKPR